MTALTEVVGTLIDAAFSTGGITDTQHTELHAKLDAGDAPAAPAPEAPAEVPLVPAAPGFGTEDTGLNG